MRASVFWIEGPWLGRLAILLRPRGGEWLDAEREAVGQLVAHISSALEAGDNIGFHCRQGIGRSGLMTAATLIVAGEDVDTALGNITRGRGLTVPETDEQRRWILAFASWHQTSRP